MWLRLVIFAGLIATGVPPVTDIDAEPNDDFAHAVRVTLPVVNGTGCVDPATDVDYYTFSLSDGGPLFVGVKASTDMTLTLFDSAKQTLTSGIETVDLPNADAGTYYLRISGMRKDCYDLQIFAETRRPPFG